MDLCEWQIYSLELDKEGPDIAEFFKSRGYEVNRVNLLERKKAETDIYNAPRKTIEDLIADAIDASSGNKRILALLSHGNWHHLTYGLAKRADNLSRRYGYIHIDHHNDLFGAEQKPDLQNVHCGKFVYALCQDANVGKNRVRHDVFFIGSKVSFLGIFKMVHAYKFLLSGTCNRLFSSISGAIERRLEQLPDDVYVSIDLDVLAPSEVRTAFDRGNMKAENLYKIMRLIKQRKNIISADIVGYTKCNRPRSAYDGRNEFWWEGIRDEEEPSFERSMSVYKTLAEIIMEK